MTLPLLYSANRSNPRSKPRYSASFTVRSQVYSNPAAKILYSGSYHMIALNAPLFFFNQADPSKLITSSRSSFRTVGGGRLIVCLGWFLEAVAISTSSTSSRGLILAASVPSNSSSPLSRFRIARVQLDSNATHLARRPFSPGDCNSQTKVKWRVRTLISLPTIMVYHISKIWRRSSTFFSTMP